MLHVLLLNKTYLIISGKLILWGRRQSRTEKDAHYNSQQKMWHIITTLPCSCIHRGVSSPTKIFICALISQWSQYLFQIFENTIWTMVGCLAGQYWSVDLAFLRKYGDTLNKLYINKLIEFYTASNWWLIILAQHC